MAENVIGAGVIEITADARKLSAGIDQAKRSLKDLGASAGNATKGQSASIDRYIKGLQITAATAGKTGRELELLKLSLRGASDAQIKAANAALRLSENYDKTQRSIQRMRTGFVAAAAIATATVVAFDRLIKSAGDFQDMAEKIGDSAEAIASLSVAAAVGGTSMEELVGASIKLTKGLQGVDDETKNAGAALTALGLNIADFKKLAPVDQIEAIAKALAGFADGPAKTAAALDLFGKAGAQLLPFLKELGAATGRQNILTGEQIRLADAYTDRQRKLRTELGLHAAAIASQTAPFMEWLTRELVNIAARFNDAQKAGLNFFEAMQARVLLMSTAPFGQISEKISVLQGKLDALRAGPQVKSLFGGDPVAEAKALEQVIDFAKRDQQTRALASTGGVDFDEPRFKRGATTLPELKVPGARKPARGGGGSSAADTARSEAAARLSADLANIKRASQETLNAFANAERIMEAMRAEGLVNDKDYYASKLAFIQLDSQAQEAALKQEISRLEREKFAGKNADKDKLANQAKLADLYLTLANNARDTTTAIEQNSIAQAGALSRVEQAFKDAKEEAQAYLDTIRRQNAREFAGIGKGQKFRDRQAALGDIEDRRIESKRGLKSDLDRNQIDQAKYAKDLADIDNYYNTEIALYEDRTTTLTQLQADGNAGMLEGMRNFYDEAQDLSKSTEEIMSRGLDGLTDQLTEFVTTGKADFKGLADSIIKELTRAFIKKQIVGALVSYFGGFSAAGGTGATVQSSAGGYAEGGQIRGAGSGTSDSIPVLLSDREFVVRADKTSQPGALRFLNTVNEHGVAAAMSAVLRNASRRAEGGQVRAPGINFMSANGALQMQRGERVSAASAPASAPASVVIHQSFAPGTDTRTINQAATAAGRVMQRAMRRNG